MKINKKSAEELSKYSFKGKAEHLELRASVLDMLAKEGADEFIAISCEDEKELQEVARAARSVATQVKNEVGYQPLSVHLDKVRGEVVIIKKVKSAIDKYNTG